jgi:hypothetical protein
MPTYVCVVQAGLLDDEQKQRIASAIYPAAQRSHRRTDVVRAGGD